MIWGIYNARMIRLCSVIGNDEDNAIRNAVRLGYISKDEKIQIVQEKMLNVEEVAQELRISKTQVRRLQDQNRIPLTLLGFRRLTSAEDVEAIKRGRANAKEQGIRIAQ